MTADGTTFETTGLVAAAETERKVTGMLAVAEANQRGLERPTVDEIGNYAASKEALNANLHSTTLGHPVA